VSLPFSDYCDPLVDDADTWNELVEPLFLFNAPIRLPCLRNNVPLVDERFVLYKGAKWHELILDRQEEELWAALRRRLVRIFGMPVAAVSPYAKEDAWRICGFSMH
jgi:hypothetical protein